MRRHGKSVGDWYGPGGVALVIRDLFASVVVAEEPTLSQLAVYVARSAHLPSRVQWERLGACCSDCAIYLDEIEALCCAPATSQPRLELASEEKPFSSFLGVQRRDPAPPVSSRVLLIASRFQCELFLEAQRGEAWQRSLILFVPLRLGTQRLNPAYAQHIRTLLSLRNCLGLIGGKPKHSLYVLGFHKDTLIYLDPHFVQVPRLI